jgi:peptidoglycan/xylan/chitin deacetylase (PgdA/CDA1 family)
LNEIRVVLTLDCERPNSETDAKASGPKDYATGVHSTLGYVKIANDRGYPVTVFLHPEVAVSDPEVFKQLEAEGNPLALHLHPWRFSDGKYPAELGGLSDDDARAVLSEATAIWQAAIGYRPTLFRGGAGSANDSTFRILSDIGFNGGSTSIPGRVYPDVHAIWAGANPDPHRANSTFRQLEGNLEFAEMPISVDVSRQVHKNGRYFHWELRPDWDVAYEDVAYNIIKQVQSRGAAVPVINMVTHNDHDFADPNDPHSRAFSLIIDSIERACERANVKPVASSVADVVVATLAGPPATVPLNRASGKVTEEPGTFFEFEVPSPNGVHKTASSTATQ